MKILVTGAAGFIGFHLSKRLLEEGHEIIGIDNLNSYYPVTLKIDRLKELGILVKDFKSKSSEIKSQKFSLFTFFKIDITSKKALETIFQKIKFDKVCHLAAQAGVRYSIQNPETYIQSNIVGFSNILEQVRNNKIDHLVYASSSSVYGESKQVPFTVDQKIDKPISLYAATKKSNELMAHVYSHLFNIATTGLRFFTVYGPYGRPDMAYSLFTDAIINEKSIKVFNNGNMKRDFTFIDDIVEGIFNVISKDISKREKFKIYNIGNNNPVELNEFILLLEKFLGKKAIKDFLPIQPGDVSTTYADVSELKRDFCFSPKTKIEKGLKIYTDWHKYYYGK